MVLDVFQEIVKMVMEFINFLMTGKVMYIKGILKMGNDMDMEHILGRTVRNMKGIGVMGTTTEKVNIHLQMVMK